MRAEFLEKLRKTPNVSRACRAVRISSSSAYQKRKADPEFQEAWDNALAHSLDELEEKSFDLAREGDGAMMRWLLATHRSEVYGNKTAQIVQHNSAPSAEGIGRREAAIILPSDR